jgi:hypothetical protein
MKKPSQKAFRSHFSKALRSHATTRANLLFAVKKNSKPRGLTRICHTSSRVQDTRLRMPNKWHICKEGKAGNKKRQVLVFSELPSLPSAGSRPGCFHTSLGCEPRSLIRASLGCSIIQKSRGRAIQLRLNRQLVIEGVSQRLLKSIGREECKHRCPKLADPTYRRTT